MLSEISQEPYDFTHMWYIKQKQKITKQDRQTRTFYSSTLIFDSEKKIPSAGTGMGLGKRELTSEGGKR